MGNNNIYSPSERETESKRFRKRVRVRQNRLVVEGSSGKEKRRGLPGYRERETRETFGHPLAMALFSDVPREQANLLGYHLFQPSSYPPPSLFSLVESNYIRQDPPALQSERKLTGSVEERWKEGPGGPKRARERLDPGDRE